MAKVRYRKKPKSKEDKDKTKISNPKDVRQGFTNATLVGGAGGISYSAAKTISDFFIGGDEGIDVIDVGLKTYNQRTSEDFSAARNANLYANRNLSQFQDNSNIEEIIKESRRVRSFIDLTGKTPPSTTLSPAGFNDILNGNIRSNADIRQYHTEKADAAARDLKKAESRRKRDATILTIIKLLF